MGERPERSERVRLLSHRVLGSIRETAANDKKWGKASEVAIETLRLCPGDNMGVRSSLRESESFLSLSFASFASTRNSNSQAHLSLPPFSSSLNQQPISSPNPAT